MVVSPEAARVVSVTPLRIFFVPLAYNLLAVWHLPVQGILGYQLEPHQVLWSTERPLALFDRPHVLYMLDNESQELQVLLAKRAAAIASLCLDLCFAEGPLHCS